MILRLQVSFGYNRGKENYIFQRINISADMDSRIAMVCLNLSKFCHNIVDLSIHTHTFMHTPTYTTPLVMSRYLLPASYVESIVLLLID